MEDALKRLDKLTQEEVRMAVAQNLKATHTVDERVRGVADTVARVDDNMKVVNDKVAEVIHGAHVIFSQTPELFNLNPSDGKETKQVIKQTADDVDLVKRSSSSYIPLLVLTVSCR
jgi:hypothetical protein